jgi:hypothetical protein
VPRGGPQRSFPFMRLSGMGMWTKLYSHVATLWVRTVTPCVSIMARRMRVLQWQQAVSRRCNC